MSEEMRVLIVENDSLIAMAYQDTLEGEGYTVCGAAPNAARAVELARRCDPDVALVDVRLANGSDGIAVAQELMDLGVRVIFVTGTQDEVSTSRMSKLDPAAILVKPVFAPQLLDALRTA